MPLIDLIDHFISYFEGPLRTEAFQDGGGIWTIGRGHTGKEIIKGLIWTRQQCLNQYALDINPIITESARRFPKADDWQKAAWCSFSYNAGLPTGKKIKSTSQAGLYIHDHNGLIEPGLVTRRKIECFVMEGMFAEATY